MLFNLTVIGTPAPRRPDELARTLQDHVTALPAAYLELMATLGPGTWCGAVEFPDPTERDGRFWFLQHRLRVDGLARHRAGDWNRNVSGDAFVRGVVLGVDRDGTAILAAAPDALCVLQPNGAAYPLGSLDHLARYIADKRRGRAVPSTYICAATSPRAALCAAWRAGDEAAADAALARVLACEIESEALRELVVHLAGPSGAGIPAPTRAAYADQLYRMARRHDPDLVELPMRAIVKALGRGELPPDLRSALAALAPASSGLFVGEIDDAERALLARVAAAPEDPARLVYADLLEQRGETARAHALRASGQPLPDAAARGLLRSPSLPHIDDNARIAACTEAWQVAAPDVALDSLLNHVAALHPTARAGYEYLLDRYLTAMRARTRDASAHLVREIADAWPQLVLALRSSRGIGAVEILGEARRRDAAPFVLSCLRAPSPEHDAAFLIAAAEAYCTLGAPAPELCDEFAPRLASADPVPRAIAFRLLAAPEYGHDPRVFDAALRAFCDEFPRSERMLKKRAKEPRVREVLRSQLAVEETKTKIGSDHVIYTEALGLLARYLAKLGDAHAKELWDRYKKFKRWRDYQPREGL